MIVVRKLGYSSNPWRLVDTDSGKEVTFESEVVQLQSGPMRLAVCGYATKQAAVDALGRLASQLLDMLRQEEPS